MIHHAVRFTSSPFTGDQLSLSMPKSTKKTQLSSSSASVTMMNPVNNNKEREKVEKEEQRIVKEMSRLGLPPMSSAELDGLLKGE